MKKYILSLALLFLFPLISQALSLSPSSLPSSAEYQPVNLTCSGATNYVAMFDVPSGFLGTIDCSNFPNPDISYQIDFAEQQDIYFIEVDNNVGSEIIDDWRNDVGFIAEITFSFTSDIYTISSMTNFATSTFLATAGFGFSELTEWSGNMTKMIIGSGIGMFSHLFPWILAIIIFATIIGFAYRGFRFFRH